jgi:S1-C subfamily serine protease
LDNLKGNYTAVGYQNKKYALSNLLEDKAAGIVFTKMAGVNLPVARLGKSSDLHLGQTVVVVAGRDQLLLTNISKIGYDFKASKDLVLNSDYFHKRIYLANQFGPDFDGALLVNFKGEVVGIISGGSAIPIDYFSNVVSQVLSKQQIVRAALGVDYLDLAQVDGLIDISDKGAYVVYEPLKGTAAFGQIKKGDLIKKVNDAELNAFSGLADVINDYNMGDIVELLISRAGKDLSVKVTLK